MWFFMEKMHAMVPSASLVDIIQGCAAVAKSCRPPFPIKKRCSSTFCSVATIPAMEEALHDMAVYPWFAGVDPSASRVPDESTILRFRHFLEEYCMTKIISAKVNKALQSKGHLLSGVTEIDAALIGVATLTPEKTELINIESSDQDKQTRCMTHGTTTLPSAGSSPPERFA